MHKIDTLNAVLGAPAPKTPGTPGWFDQGDPEVPRDATHLDQDWCNAVQGELTAAIEAAGLALDKDDRTQLLAAWSILTRDKLHGFRADPQDPASMSVDVGPGTFYDGPTGALIVKGTQPSGTFVAPTTNPRKDIIHINARTGAVGVTAGTEAASPVDPVIAFDELPVARINLTVGMTEITAAEIDDIRYLNALGTGVRRDFQILGPTALSGAAVALSGIRPGARRVIVNFRQASVDVIDSFALQLRHSGSTYQTTGYTGSGVEESVATWTHSSAFRVIGNAQIAELITGTTTLTRDTGNTWTMISQIFNEGVSSDYYATGWVTLGGELDGLRAKITGANNFDNGVVAALVE